MAVISCLDTESYDKKVLYEAICAHFDALNIINDIKPGMRVLIKPNLLSGHRPERAVTTHPHLLWAIIKWLRHNGIEDIIIADSPGGAYLPSALKNIYHICEYSELEDCATLNYDTQWQTIPCDKGFMSHSFNIINPILQADYIINAAKLKTHSMTVLSAGIKNLFGAIPGLQKPEMHCRIPKKENFAQMLVELAQTVKPNLTVIDAIECMEGNGPSGGQVHRLNLTLASKNVYEQDWFAAALMGIDQKNIPMLRIAKDKGLIEPDSIKILGSYTKPDRPFLLPKSISTSIMFMLPKGLQKPAYNVASAILKPYPKVIRKNCIGCGKCAESCPAKIIQIKKKIAVFPKKGCISCFCCQEMCKSGAIKVIRRIKL